LTRVWTKVEAIRAKQAAKPEHSPLPALPTPDAAALRAQGFEEGRDAAWTLANRLWPEAHDLLDAIAALKLGSRT